MDEIRYETRAVLFCEEFGNISESTLLTIVQDNILPIDDFEVLIPISCVQQPPIRYVRGVVDGREASHYDGSRGSTPYHHQDRTEIRSRARARIPVLPEIRTRRSVHWTRSVPPQSTHWVILFHFNENRNKMLMSICIQDSNLNELEKKTFDFTDWKLTN